MSEFETVAWLKGAEGYHVQVPVVVIYELEDGYKPLGLWIQDEAGNDITNEIEQDEYELLYEKATRHAVEYMTEAAEMMEDR